MGSQFDRLTESTMKLALTLLEELVYGHKQLTRLAGLRVLIKFAKSHQLLPEKLQGMLMKPLVPLVSVCLMYNFTAPQAKSDQDEIKKLMGSNLKTNLLQFGIEYLNGLIEKLHPINHQLYPQEKEEIKFHNKSITDTIDFISNRCMRENSVIENEGLFNRFIVQLINLRHSCSDSNIFVDRRLVKLVTDKTRVADQSPDILQTLCRFVLDELEHGRVDGSNETFRDLLEELVKTKTEEILGVLVSSEKLSGEGPLNTLAELTATMVQD